VSQSGTFGNTFVHNNGELAVFNGHNFANGGSGALPGIVGTTRNLNAYFSFTRNGSVSSVSDQAHVDGYVKNYNIPNFIFPIGDNQQYGPIGITANTINGPINAAYFNANPNVAVTSSLLGGNEVPLPLGAPFPTSALGQDVLGVSMKEYWDINGTSQVQITLYWNMMSDIDILTNNSLNTLRILGWDGNKWEVIPSTTDVGANLQSGSITSDAAFEPDLYNVYTFGAAECSDYPLLTLGDVLCSENTYSVNFLTNAASVNSNLGTISPNAVTNIPLGTDLIILAQSAAGCIQSISVKGPLSCPEDCYLPILTVGQPVCSSDPAVYQFGFSELIGASISVTSGSISNNSIINIPIGTDATITATNGQCQISYTVKSPTNCTNSCFNPRMSLSGPVCDAVLNTYSIYFTTTPGVTIIANKGVVGTGIISGIPITESVTVTANQDLCQPQIITIAPPDCRNISSIGDFVWEDLNGDGQQSIGEPGIAGVQVNLFRFDGVYLATIFTDALGKFTFENLYPDRYYLEFVAPSGFASTFAGIENDQTDSNVDNTNGPGTTSAFYIGLGVDFESLDAGYYKCISIGDLVWYDINQNDVWDSNENGINELKVNLWKHHFGNWLVWDHKYTGQKPGSLSDDGYFIFCAPPGEYYIEVIMPNIGLVRARPNIGSNEEIDSDINSVGETAVFMVLSGQTKTDIGAGFYPMAQAGNFVWRDDNANGLQDAFEPPVSGVKVEAIEWSTGNIVNEDITDDQGIYLIDYLEKQDYYFKFTPPSDYTPTIPQNGPNDIDSDVDQSFGPNTTRVFTFTPDMNNINIDLGLIYGVLPLNWLDIQAYRENDVHVVTWKTANEKNVSHYIVERKIDKEFAFKNMAGNVPPTGISNEINNYNKVDADILKKGPFYYRIKQVDFDGSFSYSPIVKIDNDIVSSIELYPNPAFDEVILSIDLANDAKVGIELYNNIDQLVKVVKKVGEEIKGETKYKIELSGYEAGIYKVIINIDGNYETKRLVKIR